MLNALSDKAIYVCAGRTVSRIIAAAALFAAAMSRRAVASL